VLRIINHFLGSDYVIDLQEVDQFERANRRETNHEGHKVSRRLLVSAFPSCTFVSLVAYLFLFPASGATTEPHNAVQELGN
jgi:hypothetical protein